MKITPNNLKLDVGTDFPVCSIKLPVSSLEAAASQESTLVMQSQFRIILCRLCWWESFLEGFLPLILEKGMFVPAANQSLTVKGSPNSTVLNLKLVPCSAHSLSPMTRPLWDISV